MYDLGFMEVTWKHLILLIHRPDCTVQLFSCFLINTFMQCTLYFGCWKNFTAGVPKQSSCKENFTGVLEHLSQCAALRSIQWFEKGEGRKTTPLMDISRQVQNQHVYLNLITLVSWKLSQCLLWQEHKALWSFLGTEWSQPFCAEGLLLITPPSWFLCYYIS